MADPLELTNERIDLLAEAAVIAAQNDTALSQALGLMLDRIEKQERLIKSLAGTVLEQQAQIEGLAVIQRASRRDSVGAGTYGPITAHLPGNAPVLLLPHFPLPPSATA